MTSDTRHVGCDRYIEAISAIVDGEAPAIDEALVDAHLARCPSCRAYRSWAESARRTLAVDAAPDMPDLSRRVSKLAAMADRASTWSIVRVLLAVVAVEIIVFAVRDLLAGSDGTGPNVHDGRHLGAFSIAYAVALLVVVARPARARTVLPVAVVLAGALSITAAIDLANGNVPLVGEALHLPELISVLLLWAIAVPARRPRRWRRALPSPSEPVRLSAIDGERDAG